MSNNKRKESGSPRKAISLPNLNGPRSLGVVSLLDSFQTPSHSFPPFPYRNRLPVSLSSTAGITADVSGRRVSPKLEEPIDEARKSITFPPPPPPSSPSNHHFLQAPPPGFGYKLNITASIAGGLTGHRLYPEFEVKEEPNESNSLHGGLTNSHIPLHPPPPPPPSSFETGSGSRPIFAIPDHPPILPPPPVIENNHVPTYTLPPYPPQTFQKPHELVRVTNVGPEHREMVNITRMLYSALRLHLVAERMKLAEILPQGKQRADSEAAYMMRNLGLWLNTEKHIIGTVPGVEIGDVFFYRMEMCTVGLHGESQGGIDYLRAGRSFNGEPIATSVVVSDGYENNVGNGEVLYYAGHGGFDRSVKRQVRDQRLENGNLAMERSMRYNIEVRVIRGVKYENAVSSKLYFYDGLYKIVNYQYNAGKDGFGMFMFKLVRIENQPKMGSAVMKEAEILKSNPFSIRPKGYISLDISVKKENVPVYLYNDVDADVDPLRYVYVTKSFYSLEISRLMDTNRTGCVCYNKTCSEDCLCVRKNGGEFAYDVKGNLLRGKHVVFECGIYCKCGPSCRNRVTQKGLSKRLEIFKSKETGWGVRTLDVIQAGGFICEYAGAVVTKYQADIMSIRGGVVYPGWFEEKWRGWGDLSRVYPDYVKAGYSSLPPVDYGIDVSVLRNVAAFIRHSKNANLMVQFVVYDAFHLAYPRVMLFALENISPLTELTLDYGLGLAAEASGNSTGD